LYGPLALHFLFEPMQMNEVISWQDHPDCKA